MLCVQFLFWYIAHNWNYGISATPARTIVKTRLKLSECPTGTGQVQKTQNAMSNCLFALGPNISPMTNVLLTDLGLTIPLSFIDKCISTSVDSTIY